MQKSHLGGDEDLPEWPEELKQEYFTKTEDCVTDYIKFWRAR